MTVDQSALLELSEALRKADGGDLMRMSLGSILQALVDAEATAHIGAAPHERPRRAPPSATAPATRSSPPVSVM